MKGYYILMIYIICPMTLAMAQVGINTVMPDTSAVLHIQALPKYGGGVLFPRINISQREVLSGLPPAHSLFLFDVAVNKFVNYDAGQKKWLVVNPWNQSLDNNGNFTNISINQTIDCNQINASQITASQDITCNTLKAKELKGTYAYAVPPGAIIMWSGDPVKLPAGWNLCDGTNGTPDLRGRFIVGYGNDGTGVPTAVWDDEYKSIGPGAKGKNKHKLLVSEMPAHNHQITDPGHKHSFNDKNCHQIENVKNGSIDAREASFTYDASITASSYTGITIKSKGGNQAHENRPPYFILAFIMKL